MCWGFPKRWEDLLWLALTAYRVGRAVSHVIDVKKFKKFTAWELLELHDRTLDYLEKYICSRRAFLGFNLPHEFLARNDATAMFA